MAQMRRAPPKPLKQALLDNAPWMPVEPTLEDVGALQALARGDASETQQKHALAWFIQAACRTYDVSYRPGGFEGERDTAFAEGRRFPGLQTVKMVNFDIRKLKARESK